MIRSICTGVILLGFVIQSAIADTNTSTTPESQGLAIAEEAARRDEGFGDTVAKLNMQLIAADGRVRTRSLTWKILEETDPEEGDKSLTVFHEPRDIRGTGFLSYTHIDQADDQWLYLPALKRVKRISSTNKASSFVGSEFAYEDLLSDEVAKFTYRWLRDERCAELACFVVERKPLYENSGYSRQVVWIDQSEFRFLKIEYYDNKDRLKKRLQFDDFRQYLDQFWRAHTMNMEGVQTGKRTILRFENFDFQTGLSEQAFTPSALKRIR